MNHLRKYNEQNYKVLNSIILKQIEKEFHKLFKEKLANTPTICGDFNILWLRISRSNFWKKKLLFGEHEYLFKHCVCIFYMCMNMCMYIYTYSCIYNNVNMQKQKV